MSDRCEWVRVWAAFLNAEATENLGLKIEARRRLSELALAASDEAARAEAAEARLAFVERERDLWRKLGEARAELNTAYRVGRSVKADAALMKIEVLEDQLRGVAAHGEKGAKR